MSVCSHTMVLKWWSDWFVFGCFVGIISSLGCVQFGLMRDERCDWKGIGKNRTRCEHVFYHILDELDSVCRENLLVGIAIWLYLWMRSRILYTAT